MLRYLLDTNIVIYVIKRRPPQARLCWEFARVPALQVDDWALGER